MQIPRLAKWRELQGWTQKDLAHESGVSARSIAGYETGASVRPRTARKLAEALGVEVIDLAGIGQGKVPAPPLPEQPSFNGLLEEERRSSLSPWVEYVRQRADRIRRHTADPQSLAFRDASAAQFFVEDKNREAADLLVRLNEKEMGRDPYGEEPLVAWQEVLSALKELTEALDRALERAKRMEAGRIEIAALNRQRRQTTAAVAEREKASAGILSLLESRGA